MREKSRTFNSILNSITGIAAALITVVINFAVRIVIVRFLGEEINGLHNLFQNTINVLAVMESGLSTAIVIHLYAPIEKKDEEAAKKLLSFYQKIYLWMALIFLALGVAIDFFVLDKIVTTTVPMSSVRLYFFVFSLSFFFNYLTYTKRSVLFAEQKNRVSMLVTTVSEVLFRGVAVCVAIFSGEYLFFLFFLVAEKVFGNVICIIYVNKKHPSFRRLRGVELEKDKKKEVFGTIKPLLVNQISSTVQNSANSVLISILLGSVAIVGYYGNYQLIISTVHLMFSQLGGAFTTSFGNLSVSGDTDRMYRIYKKSNYIMIVLAIICCSGFIACVQDFIALAFGSSFVLEMSSVMILMLSLFVYLMTIPVVSVQNALGLHKLDAVVMVVQAVTAVALGYVGGVLFGMNGIFIGLLLPNVACTLIYKGLKINKAAFGAKWNKYVLQVLWDILKFVVIVGATFAVCYFINFSSLILNILVKGIVAVLVSCVGIAIFSIKSEFRKEIFNSVKNKLFASKKEKPNGDEAKTE